MITLVEEIRRIRSSGGELRKFGLTLGSACLLFGFYGIWRGKVYASAAIGLAAVLILVAVLAPSCLKPIHKTWMAFALVMGACASKVILFVLFYFVNVPTGLVLRIMGKDLLGRKFPGGKASYWLDRTSKSKTDCERQF